MPHPPSRRKAATDLEIKISAGDPSVVGQLVDLLDRPLHRHLVMEFPSMLSEKDREDLIADFIADVVDEPSKYDKSLASIEHFAKKCVKNKAIDLIRRRDTQKQYELGPGTAAVLSLTPSTPSDDLEFRIVVERAKVVVEGFDPKYKAALLAFRRHGKAGYKKALVKEFGVTSDTAATWLARARKLLEEALGITLEE